MTKIKEDWSRRKFITAATGAGAALMIAPEISWAINQMDPNISVILDKMFTMGIDAHNHVDVPLNNAELPAPDIDLRQQLTKSGLTAISMTFAVDYQMLVNPGDGYNRFLTGLDAMDEVLKSNGMKRALNLADLNLSYKNKIPTVIQSVEGGHFLEGNIDRLATAYNRGLRHLTLLHDNDAAVPLGDVFTNPAKFGGLTDFGAEVIRQCNNLGILVDLSHANNETLNAALKVAVKPVLVSHTGIDTQLGQNQNMSRMMKPRLISKEQAKIVADAGGVIGVWTHLAETPLEYAQNIRAMVDAAGIDHVCIGTDTKMTPPYRSINKKDLKPADNNDSRKNEKTEIDKQPKGFSRTTNETWADQNKGFFYTVIENLIKVGLNENEIAKIGAGNFCRIFDAATTGK